MTFRFLKICSLLLLTITIVSGCSWFETEKDNKSKNLIGLAALASKKGSVGSSSTREMYAGFADIPVSIYKTVASGSATSSIQTESRTLSTTDYKFVGTNGSVSSAYDSVKTIAKSTRDIAKSIGTLVSTLESITVSTTTQTKTGTWGDAGTAANFQYKPSTILPDGKKLEVWWDKSATTPYSSSTNTIGNKAIELNYTGSSTGSVSGFLFARFLYTSTATTLSKAYINFKYDSSTKTRTMVVILQGIGTNFTDNAHFFVQEIDGVTTMDGTFTVSDFNANSAGNLTGVTASARAYVFSAIGDSSKSVIKVAFPLATDATTLIYGNTSLTQSGATGVPGLANIGQVWTNFLLADSTLVTNLNSIGNVCSSSYIVTTSATGGNPTSFTGITPVATLKNCLDAIITAGQTSGQPTIASGVKALYFLTNTKNPAYFTVSGSTVSLYGVESIETSDTNKSSFDSLENNSSFLSTVRTTSNTTYAAAFDAVSVTALNLFTGVSVPTGTSATNLTNLNVQWGDGASTGTASTATAGSNFINGSADNTAP